MASLRACSGVSPEVLAVFGCLEYGGDFGVLDGHVLGISEAGLLVAAVPFLGSAWWFGGGEVNTSEEEGMVGGRSDPFEFDI